MIPSPNICDLMDAAPFADPNPHELIHRLVLDYYTATRLLGVLHSAVQQHESVYGVLEIDVQKRMR
jgi:hypothetical protein